MTWTWVRPADPGMLSGRPLLDLGTGDGQTGRALAPDGFVVGLDRDLLALGTARRGGMSKVICAEALDLPLRSRSVEVVLAADLFHHLDEPDLMALLDSVLDVLRPGGRLVAWWYEQAGRPGVGAPAYPRSYERVAADASDVGFPRVEWLDLDMTVESGPPTVGLVAVR